MLCGSQKIHLLNHLNHLHVLATLDAANLARNHVIACIVFCAVATTKQQQDFGCPAIDICNFLTSICWFEAHEFSSKCGCYVNTLELNS